MPHTMWSGTLAVGLVSVPVKMHAAIGRSSVELHQYDSVTQERIRLATVSAESKRDVPRTEIIKGYDADGGPLVYLTPTELAECEPAKSREITVHHTVRLDEIDPMYLTGTYYLAPDTGTTSRPNPTAGKSYALLAAALVRTGRVAVIEWVMRGRPYLGVVRPVDRLLVVHTLSYLEQVRGPSDIPLPTADYSAAELGMAEQLLEALADDWRPERYRNEHTRRVTELIEAKRRVAANEDPDPMLRAMEDVEALLAELDRDIRAVTPRERVSTRRTQTTTRRRT